MLNRTVKTAMLAAGVVATVIGGSITQALAQSRDLWLYDGQQADVNGFFFAGESIFAWCDQDCEDLDLILFDSQGNFVTQDVLLDAAPVVVAPYEGNFRVRVTMPNCTHPAGCAVWVDSDAGF